MTTHGYKVGEEIVVPLKRKWWLFWKPRVKPTTFVVTAVTNSNSFGIEHG